MSKVKEFRGLIYSKYDSENEFARVLNWKRQRLNKITNGLRLPALDEVAEMARALGVEPSYLMQIFLSQKSSVGQQ